MQNIALLARVAGFGDGFSGGAVNCGSGCRSQISHTADMVGMVMGD
jgi:hypothetical protein